MKNVAIVAGGDSGEYEISIKGANVIYNEIDKNKYNPYIIYIKGKEWAYIDETGSKYSVNLNDFSICIKGQKITFDLVFNIIHGTPGEDGHLQSYFDLLKIPYTSSNHITSAITFNKGYCNRIISTLGIKVAKSIHILNYSENIINEISDKLMLPVFVKPALGGSSVGITKVKLLSNLDSALKIAFKESPEVLVEESIEGKEITCGVLKKQGEIIALPITEIISHKEFFDYEAKYTPGMSDEITPAQIPEKQYKLCQDISKMIYEKLHCKGVIRIDYILKEEELYFLEINTIPGMTPQSIVPQQAKTYGISLKELISILLEECTN